MCKSFTWLCNNTKISEMQSIFQCIGPSQLIWQICQIWQILNFEKTWMFWDLAGLLDLTDFEFRKNPSVVVRQHAQFGYNLLLDNRIVFSFGNFSQRWHQRCFTCHILRCRNDQKKVSPTSEDGKKQTTIFLIFKFFYLFVLHFKWKALLNQRPKPEPVKKSWSCGFIWSLKAKSVDLSKNCGFNLNL